MSTNKECIDTPSGVEEITTLDGINSTAAYDIDNLVKTVTIISDQQIIYSNYIPNSDQTFEISTIPITITESTDKQISYTTMTNVPFTVADSNKFIIHIEPNTSDDMTFSNYTPTAPISTHTCDVCAREFKQKLDFEIHKKTHAIEQINASKSVAKSRKSKPIADSVQKKTYFCKTCNHFFTNRFDLVVHERIHEPLILEYSCAQCPKQFSSREKLNAHALNSHNKTNCLSFICDTCNRKFKTMALLNSHKRVHAQSRNYVCTICDKGFSAESHLKSHMNMHSGETKLLNTIMSNTDKIFEEESYPYKCQYCDRTHETKTSLHLHVKSVHKIYK